MTINVKTSGAAWCALGLLTLVSGCDSGPSATPARDHARSAAAADTRGGPASAGASSEDQGGGLSARRYADRYADARPQERDRDPAPLYHGKPLWSSNRKYSAEENVQYHFQHDGEAVGARSMDDFVAKAHAFIDSPPRGALVIERRSGDRLIYDPKANLFAVATKDGAPRTLFKPRDGMAYWEQQKAREARGQSAGRNRRSDDDQG